MIDDGIEGLVVSTVAETIAYRRMIAQLVQNHRLPAIPRIRERWRSHVVYELAAEPLLQLTTGVCFGSSASFWPWSDHFRSSPINGHSQGQSVRLKRAQKPTKSDQPEAGQLRLRKRTFLSVGPVRLPRAKADVAACYDNDRYREPMMVSLSQARIAESLCENREVVSPAKWSQVS
jgi:hypothetical protein